MAVSSLEAAFEDLVDVMSAIPDDEDGNISMQVQALAGVVTKITDENHDIEENFVSFETDTESAPAGDSLDTESDKEDDDDQGERIAYSLCLH